jgi:hypothetical protein
MTPKEFFNLVYQHTPEPLDKHYVAWGSPQDPVYLSIAELLSGDWLGSIPSNRDWYYSPGVLAAPRRIKSNVRGSSVVWIDQDSYKDAIEPLLPPSFRVSSGKGQHLYYVLDNFYSSQDIEQVNKALLAHIALPSEGTWDATRILRVPGSNNCKYLNQDKYPEYTEALSCAILETTEYTYALTDLARLLTYDPGILHTPTNGNGKVDRSRRDWKVGTLLQEWGISRYAVGYFLQYYSTKGMERPGDYVNRTLDKLFEPVTPTEGEVRHNKFFNAAVEPTAKLYTDTGREVGMVISVKWDDQQLQLAATQDDFKSSAAVNNWLSRNDVGNRIFTGGDKDAKLLFTLMVTKVPPQRMLRVDHAGRFDMPDGTRLLIYSKEAALTWPEGANYGIFLRPKIGGVASLYPQLEPSLPDPEGVYKLLDLTLQTQQPAIIQPALGWLMMTPFKAVLSELGLSLPHLHLFGFPGCGKTSLIGSVLLPLLGCFTTSLAADGTTFGILGNLTLTNAWPVWFGEFRATNHNVTNFLRLLREDYDRGQEPRGKPDQTVVSHILTSPVVIDGESPFTDGANAERTIALRLDKATVAHNTSYAQAYTDLIRLDKTIWKQFAHAYFKWTLTKDTQYIQTRLAGSLNLFRLSISASRTLNNFAIAWVGLQLLQEFLKDMGWPTPLTPDIEAFHTAREFVHSTMGVKTFADTFVETLAAFYDMPAMRAYYEPETDVLWFSLIAAHKLLRIHLDLPTLELQLEERTGSYIVNATKQADGGLWWGIQVGKAQDMGLNVPRPLHIITNGLKLVESTAK